MAISVDWDNKLVLSTASIPDVVAFKDAIRDLEDDATGMLYPPIITYKRVDLGGGAYFHAIAGINGYQLKFPNAGNYTVIGNIDMPIVPVAGVFVDRTKAAAFATVAGEGGATIPESLLTQVSEIWARLGLDASKPLVTTESSISFGAVNMELTSDTDSVTVQRL